MSELKAQDNENNSTTSSNPSLSVPTVKNKRWQGEMSRSQALAVSWTGLQVLATNGQLLIFNDRKTKKLWIGIANAKIARSQDGNVVRLVDLEALAGLHE